MDRLACPIRLLVNAIAPSGGTLDEKYGCLDFCEWYDNENECCAILTLARKGGSSNEATEV